LFIYLFIYLLIYLFIYLLLYLGFDADWFSPKIVQRESSHVEVIVFFVKLSSVSWKYSFESGLLSSGPIREDNFGDFKWFSMSLLP